MSLKLNERYPARFNNPTAGYPQGSFKNRTTPTAKDGSYLEKDWANDKEGFFQSLLSAAGITANGAVDAVGASQFFDALQALKQIQAGTAFTTAGSAGALTLTPTPAISAYSAPLRFRVKFSVASTGTDTLNVSGLGVKNLKRYDSTGAKISAVFAVSQLADVEYDGTDFVVMNQLPVAAQATESVSGIAKVATQAMVNAGADDTAFVTSRKLRFGFSTNFSSNGYIIFPSWLGSWIVQWGLASVPTVNGINGTITANFNIAFPNNCHQMASTHDSPGTTASYGFSSGFNFNKDAFSAGVRINSNGGAGAPTSVGIRWIAVGN